MTDNEKISQSVVEDSKQSSAGNIIRKTSKGLPLKLKLIFGFIILLVVGGAIFFTYDQLFVNKGHRLSTVSSSTLTDVIEISNLSTLEFTYNAVVTVNTDEETPKVKYHVSYEGLVTAGIDIKKVEVSIEDNRILITVPEATIQSVSINPGTLDFIFEKSKYNTQDVPSEAYKLCKQDLERRAQEEEDLLKVAKENAASAISALIEPWIAEVSSDYIVEVR